MTIAYYLIPQGSFLFFLYKKIHCIHQVYGCDVESAAISVHKSLRIHSMCLHSFPLVVTMSTLPTQVAPEQAEECEAIGRAEQKKCFIYRLRRMHARDADIEEQRKVVVLGGLSRGSRLVLKEKIYISTQFLLLRKKTLLQV
jgi:hypothetical protein